MGYNVEFPSGKRPFPAQFAVMNKVLTALKTEQHALLESPTGSGKTLALLCSSLTYQKQFIRDKVMALEKKQQDPIVQEQEAKKQAQETQLRVLKAQICLMEAREQIEEAKKQRQDENELNLCNVETTQEEEGGEGDDVSPTQVNLDGEWLKSKKRELEMKSTTIKKKTRMLPNSFALATKKVDTVQIEDVDVQTVGSESKSKEKQVVPPQIFFCSRTHSQLAQVLDELKSCPVSYLNSSIDSDNVTKELQACVLGSKRNMCINRKVNRDPLHVDEKCRQALEESSCSYHRKRSKVNDLRRSVPPVWDIEDLVKLAQKHRECAYFHAREALNRANIVFAPYNYLLDPTIREAVGIKLKGSIIILDEAHNVEDTCRSSASVEVTADALVTSIKAFSIVIKYGNRPDAYNTLLKLLNGISRWLQEVDSNANAILEPSGYEEKSKVWDGADALAMLAEYSGLTKDNLAEVKAKLHEVREYETELGNSSKSSQQPQTQASQDAAENPTGASVILGALALTTVESIMCVVDYMFRDNLKYIDDFKLVVIKLKSAWKENASFQSPTKRNGDEWTLKMCVWCLNAAVAFSDVASQARSVILTSGTLSPMESFAGELGVNFPIRLEANHVVNMRKQVFIGAVMQGPGNVDLQSTYNNQQDPRYQDSIGQLLMQYSRAIPGGILMFFPSYSLLHKLTTRWKKTKLWDEIAQYKAVYSEPRNAGKDFDALLEDYKSTITKYSEAVAADDNGSAVPVNTTGAIFLAVYRGKVSEGIDFSNDNARAVLCVGIPFPSVKELQVSLKRKYQDEKSRMNIKLVNGHIWYQLQAFRALNQALGRCIRHREDYGAIMLLDSRHRFNKHTKSLSKWMRPFIQEFEHSQMCVPLLSDFFQRNCMELLQPVPLPLVESALSTSSQWKTKRVPLVLEYEVVGKKDRKKSVKANCMTTSSLSSTLATVKDFMAKQKKELDRQDSVFSLFRHQDMNKSK
ncbi:unnamed protein product [Peronospora belbahrii]|uniref:Helicase ATP-binding domain-containing protein n=1 Tax=Peronospora belbahrii TaxID=622444 RepID=A0AAU9KLV3_9STRA|nr:unnamed protein product [Peronospora belbahrii]